MARLVAVLALLNFLGGACALAAEKVDFVREIQPILMAHCYDCHGPVTQKAKLRWDRRDSVMSFKEKLIVAGDVKKSLLAKMIDPDADEPMPPVGKGTALSPRQVTTVHRWIEQGGEWPESAAQGPDHRLAHWAFKKPVRPALPPVEETAKWSVNPIDRFTYAAMTKQGYAPSEEADRYTLARRAAIDLIGVPPTLEEADAFVKDASPDAFEKYVDRLMASKKYGERWAALWLDLARYADSNGYADDKTRIIWRWRDWVIDALNDNLRFDRFTIEQIAGDLLPDATKDQILATGFHRNSLTNDEGGTDDEEFRVAAVKDRVNTTMQVWMGMTMGCAECHDHKYDPLSQKEYYQLYAVFNQTEDSDKGDNVPLIEMPTADQAAKIARLNGEIAAAEKELAGASIANGLAKWEAAMSKPAAWREAKIKSARSKNGAEMTVRADGSVLVGGNSPATDSYAVEVATDLKKVGAVRIEALTDPTLPATGPGRAGNGNFVLSRVGVDVGSTKTSAPAGKRVRISLPGREKILSLAEVQVFSGGTNIALQGSAAQVSTAYEGEAKRAIDGNTNGDYFGANSTTHTVKQDDPFWELTLPKAAAIEKIVIWNRTDGQVGVRLADFNVAIVDEGGNQVWATTVAKTPTPSVTLATDGAKTPKFVSAAASFEQANFAAQSVIDNADLKNKGWAIAPDVSKPQWIVLSAAAPFAVREDGTLTLTLDHLNVSEQHTIGAFRVSLTDQASAPGSLPANVAVVLRIEANQRTASQRAELAAYYRAVAPETKALREKIDAKRKEAAAVKPATSPIMRELAENKQRKTNILLRGNFLTKGETVSEATPAVFHAPPGDRKLDRLALAKWLVSAENPLTARVVVNRYWEQFFGMGIVETSEDFGVRSKPPTHPDLLDWLAVEFSTDWDVKRLHKLIVTSQTYRQSAKATPEMLAKDPNNIWLSRGPRLRATAETVRDQTLVAAGMLSEKMYGPPVRPPRPKLGLAAAFSGSTDWEPSPGEDRYRRAMYTEWRRTTPYPSMMTFDASNRNVCTLKRTRTNTPLQALVTLNDPVYVEAAQALGRRMIKDGGPTDADRLRHGFRIVLTRPPTDAELARLISLLDIANAKYADDKKSAEQMAGMIPTGVDPATAAAYTVAANVLLNLDEAVHKR